MRRRLSTSGLVAGLLVLSVAVLIPATLLAEKKAPYNDAYSMETLALKGPEVTDVYATFSTDDPGAFPIPDALKKLQVKIKDAEGEVAFIQNAWDVTISDNVATMSAGDPPFHETLYVKAHIKTGKREVVLQDETMVLLRPDLFIEGVTAPDEVDADEPFNVEVVVGEGNLEFGATATISLYDGTEFMAAITGTEIGPGERVTYVFAGISLADIGTHELRIVISDADPAEYDDTNNEASFTVEVIQHLQTSTYSIQYTNYTNYYYYYRYYRSCWGSYYTYTREYGSWDDLYLNGSSTGIAPNAPIEGISWTVESEKGVFNTGSHTNVAPTAISEEWDEYYLFDEATWTMLSVNVNKLTGLTYFAFSQFSGSRVEIYYYRSGSWYGYSTTTVQQTANYMDARQFVNVSLLLDDDAVTIGGTAAVNLGPMQNYSNGYNYSGSWWGCYYSQYLTHTYNRVSGSGGGTMDPAGLGKRISSMASTGEVLLPKSVNLAGNYPNPFNPSTSLRFALPEGAPVSLVVYDLAGREVARLVDSYISEGYHEVVWDGRNAFGALAPTGIYLARMVTPGYARTIKMVMMK
ncbi:MAG: T9SS type A sorting domain-containing protein [Fidelibacterota bacterium]|nr:MAG: T9SS type A sorting domain-containing protein [Candidatus Neomarinimicrobiota bacterium]